MNDYITQGRYPGDISFEIIGIEQAKSTYEVVKKIKEFVEKKIKNQVE